MNNYIFRFIFGKVYLQDKSLERGLQNQRANTYVNLLYNVKFLSVKVISF